MDIPLELSGNFMEPRSNHFHSGLDMRTQGREGIPVKAVADGWVSRIKISPWGYGKAVYIDHPDGRTSVYGHLSALRGAIATACLDAQYRARDFSIDLTPEKGAIPVRQGEVIALSGNTGGSGGPHLHFELRRSSDQHALDPEALGIEVADNVPPEIIGVRFYPLNDSSSVGPYPAKAVGFAAQGGAGRYALKAEDRPTAYGTIGMALHTIDRYDSGGAKCGVRSIAVFVDSLPVFSTAFNEIDFNTNRYCNAHMDFGLFKGNRMDYHRCYRQPNDKLRIYGKEAAQGHVSLVPDKDHRVRFVVLDASGNRSELTFDLHGATGAEALEWPRPALEGSLFPYDRENILKEEGVRLTMPALALYDDTYILYARREAFGRLLTPVHMIHDPLTPIHSNCELEIDLPSGFPPTLAEKVLIVRVDANGKQSAVGGKLKGGAVSAQVREFGGYGLMMDTIAPTIRNVDLKADMAGRSGFSIKVTDDLAGIDTWKGTLNGEWILMEYEPKTNTLTHTFDKHTRAAGKKEFTLEVKDDRGNAARYVSTFSH
ncbi:MAG: M23 family metallopeptidase [Flavobacteriales bacterium]